MRESVNQSKKVWQQMGGSGVNGKVFFKEVRGSGEGGIEEAGEGETGAGN